jgi:hypothetical protein
MLTCARSARGGGTSSLHPPPDSTLVFSNGYLMPQRWNTYVPPSKCGTTSLSLSASMLVSHGLSQGGTVDLGSNSISKFQNSDFEILESSYQTLNILLDNSGHNSISGVTVFSLIDGTSQTTSSDCLASDSSYTMASSPG